MVKFCGIGKIIALGFISVLPVAHAADNYSEAETHVMRGISERQNTLNRMSALAVEKGSTELVRTLARLDMAEHASLNVEVRELAAKIGIAGVGMGAGAGPGGPAAGPPPGAAPGAAPGGPPGGGARAGGPASYGNRYYQELQTLTGAAFDEKYLLRALQYHEDLERTINGEIRDGVNPELIAWSKTHIRNYEAHALTIQRALFGELTSVPAEAKTVAKAGARRGGPPAAAPAAGR